MCFDCGDFYLEYIFEKLLDVIIVLEGIGLFFFYSDILGLYDTLKFVKLIFILYFRSILWKDNFIELLFMEF